jgi:hypothetical protein
MSSDKQKLDDSKRRYLEAKQEIERLRMAIASETCPLQIGETITVVEDGKEYQGTIEHIGYANGREELLGPVVGAETGWAASGSRLGKSSGKPVQWSFGINSLEAELVGGKWVITKQSLDDILNLSSQKP